MYIIIKFTHSKNKKITMLKCNSVTVHLNTQQLALQIWHLSKSLNWLAVWVILEMK